MINSSAIKVPPASSATPYSNTRTGEATIGIDLDDPTSITISGYDQLVTDLVYEVRVVHRDIWVSDSSNPLIHPFTVTFSHQCKDSQLTANTVPTDINYVIALAQNQGASTTSSVVASSNLSTCTTLYSRIELW